MSHGVYADGWEIAGKAGMNKSISRFPDVCLSPPSPPAGPIPVPYPNTSFSSDLKEGSKTVKLGGQPAALAQQSYYKPSVLGNEAATRNFGMNILSHTITGKTYFRAWSMDVKIEGKNVCRHYDLTTSNHACDPVTTSPNFSMEEAIRERDKRIAKQQCPCCGSEDCPAAFKSDDVPLTAEQYYGTTPQSKENLVFAKQYHAAHCRCKPENRVFPQPPCDVFRQPDQERYNKILAAWEAEGVKISYRAAYEAQHGVKLLDATAILNQLIAMAPNADAIRKGMNLRRGDPAKKPWDMISAKAKKLERINHLVPKEAGGCPTNPGNLQPQQTLCEPCQDIDQFFTEHMQGAK